MCQLLNHFDFLTFPCLIQLPPLKVLLLVGAVMAGERSLEGLSVLSHMYTKPANRTSRWAEEMTMPIIPLSPRRCCELSRTFDSPFSIVAHPHARKNALCLTQRNSFSVWSHAARRGIRFDYHLHFPQRGIWCVSIRILGSGVNFSHAQDGRMIFLPHCDLSKSSQWLHC